MIVVIAGTRPELIKTAPVLHELGRRSLGFHLIHTGQHYSHSLDEVFFEDLQLPKPYVNLHVGSSSAGHQIAQIISGVSDVLQLLKASVILVQGDTNSVLGGALAGFKLGIPVAHLEAGLRSDDWGMPEEGNRVLAGRVASLHFCPTALQSARLAAEGIFSGVHVVGNTVVDASLHFARIARERSRVLSTLKLDGRRYGILTLHRPSNVDSEHHLASLLRGVDRAARENDVDFVFPIHPRTADKIKTFGLSHLLNGRIQAVEPVGYVDMLRLIQESTIVLTDSGGLQEEACTLRVPCVTLRPNTERPETVDVGANVLFDGTDGHELSEIIALMSQRTRTWINPFGDGKTSARVVRLMADEPIPRLGSRVEPS